MLFENFLKERTALEREFGDSLGWDRMDQIDGCRIYKEIPFSISDPDDVLESAKRWGVDMMAKIVDTFHPRIKRLQK